MPPFEVMQRLPASMLVAWGEAIYRALGSSPNEAAQIARGLVDANLSGHDSHGIRLTPHYAENVRGGHAIPNAKLETLVDAGSMVSLDGGRGFGQATGEAAMSLAIERARAHGCAVVGLSNTHHLGRIGQWGERCAAEGLVSIHFVNVRSRPIVAPWGGRDARVSTNPFCVAVPHSPHPLVLDYATAAVALGKTGVAKDRNEPMAPGLLLDSDGEPTQDPGVMWREPCGAIVSFAQHKGWALSVVCEILGGALSGGHVQDGVTIHPMMNNMLTIAFDPSRLGTARTLPDEIERLARWVRASPRAADSEGVLLPGEPERRTADDRLHNGIPMPSRTLDDLADVSRSLGIPAPWKDATHEQGVRVAG